MAGLEAPPQASGSPEPGGEGVGKVVGRRCIALLAAGTLLTFLAMGSLWGWRTFASSQGFADVATDMLRDAAVREVVSDKIVTALEAQDPTAELAASYRPVMKSVVALVVGTPAFQGRLPFRGAGAPRPDRPGVPVDGEGPGPGCRRRW